jgi:RimJ/RimL family protein N-acetyltransferase
MLILFRPANGASGDCYRLFEWRNDPETRHNSRDTGFVDMSSHSRWFERSLMNPNRKIMIAEADGAAVAVVRLDRHSDGSFELSWTVAPAERRKGYGSEVVKRFIAELPRPLRLYAEIKQSNRASLKIAERAGFEVIGTRDDLVLLEMELVDEPLPVAVAS